jgi:hypothetical protein
MMSAHRMVWQRRASALAVIAALAAAGCWETPTAPSVDDLLAQVVVQITFPANGAVLTTPDLTIAGTYSPAGLRDDIWVLIWPEFAPGVAYAQSPNAAAGEPATVDRVNQRWSVPAGLGGPAQSYEISVHIASEAASQVLSRDLVNAVAANFFPGILRQALPAGLIEKQRITIRKVE